MHTLNATSPSRSRTAISAICAMTLVLGVAPLPTWAQSQGFELEEVVVTAQRREESLQDVPAAITALTSDDLELRQVGNVLDLQASAPNITFSRNTGTSSGARLYMRGIGEDESRATVEPAVSMYVDDVYIGRQIGALYELVDLERVEVLRGPQGTLYGRNSNGGAIRLISVKPNFDESSYKLKLTAGDEGRIDGILSGNVAVSDDTAIRFSVMNRQRDGLFSTVATPAAGGSPAVPAEEVGEWDVTAYRVSALWQPADNLDVLLSFDRVEDDSDPLPPSLPALGDAVFTIAVPRSGANPAYSASVEQQGLSLDINWDLGAFTLRSLTATRELDDELHSVITANYDQVTNQDQLSQEFQISSNGDSALNWVAGFFYYDEDIALDYTFFGFGFDLRVDTSAWAAFGQASYDLDERTRLTFGARYTDEEKDFRGEATDFGACRPAAPASATGSCVGRSEKETRGFTNTDVKLAVNHDLSDDITLYASYTTGFKSGAWSPDGFPPAIFLPVDEEEVKTYEIGLRSNIWDNRLRLNITLFDNDYTNLQLSGTTDNGFTRFNVPEAATSGAELELTALLTPDWSVNFNVGYLDADYESLDLSSAIGITNTSAPNRPDPSDSSAVSQLIATASGFAPKNAPQWTSGLSSTYRTSSLGLPMALTVDFAYQSESYNLIANTEAVKRDDAIISNLRLAFGDPEDSLTFAVWGKNLENKIYYAAGLGSGQVFASEPRTVGVDVTFRF